MYTVKHKLLDDMNVNDVVDSYRTATITYHDGNIRKIFYTDIETVFPEGEKIISVTDPDGYITNANSTFVYMSGYSKKELLGAPHCILRHPDMPRAAFQELWDSLAKTGKWHGYVKNLRKDGGFYWASASVFALYRHDTLVGYTSTREAVPMDKVQDYTELYQRLRAQEQK